MMTGKSDCWDGVPVTSRREFLQAGLIASALPIAARADLDADELSVPLYKVVYDVRFPASVGFARRVSQRGLAVHAIAGDMTSLWYDDLYRRWQRSPAAIAGLTAHGALFCLERLAWDQRMRVVYRGEHALAAGCVAHRFEASTALLSSAVRAAAEASWEEALADVVASCPPGRATHRAGATITNALTLPTKEALYSWVIAPVAHA
jgi:hypothetical protein